MTSVFVTHDQEEALELADRVVVMNKGRIEQDGTPEEVVEHPATPFVVNFLGQVNIFHGRVQSGRALLGRCRSSIRSIPTRRRGRRRAIPGRTSWRSAAATKAAGCGPPSATCAWPARS